MIKTKYKKITSLRGTSPTLGVDRLGEKQSLTYRKRARLWIVFGITVLIIIPPLLFIFRPKTNTTLDIQKSRKEIAIPTPVIPAQAETPQPLPVSKNLSVPYAQQAPFSNWTVHEESCEEAAIYMYKTYFDGTAYPNNQIPEADLDTVFRAMKKWQVTNLGSEPDLTMTALGEFARSYYGYTPIVKKNITAEDIKTAISENHPIIVPVMTHSLQNSNYGPETTYHVLLIKGYDTTGVFTNDAGVGNGPNHHYTWEILWQAIDAQTPKMGAGREMLYLIK